MSNHLISNPFFFSNDSVRAACVTALGLSAAGIDAGEIVLNSSSSLLLTHDLHSSKIIVSDLNSPSATTITVQTDAVGDFVDKDQITVIQIGTGSVTIVADSGVTINTTESLELRKQYSVVQLIRQDVDTWLLVGDTAGNGVPVYPFVVPDQIYLQTVNTSDTYVETSVSETDLGNVTALGGDISVSGNQLIIPALYSCPMEIQLDGISVVTTDVDSFFKVVDLSSDAVTMVCGVSPFSVGGEKWIKLGVKIVPLASGTVNAQLIINDVLIGTAHSVTIATDTLGFGFDFASSSAFLSVNSTLYHTTVIPSYASALYTRIFISDTDSSFNFYVEFTGKSNGRGNRLKTRLSTTEGYIEVEGNLLEQ